MRYLPLLLAAALLLCSSLALADGDRAWEVKWYETRPKTGGGVYTVFLASESWTETNFHYSWGGGRIYENYTNNLQFTATTLVYGDGDTHTLELYDVDDLAWVTLDGDEILRVEMTGDRPANGTAQVTIPEGQQLLRVNWREDCCSASVGFHMPEELYTPGEDSDSQAPGFGGAVLAAAVALYLIWKHRDTRL